MALGAGVSSHQVWKLLSPSDFGGPFETAQRGSIYVLHVFMFIYIYAHTCMHAYIRTYVRMYIYIYTYICIYIIYIGRWIDREHKGMQIFQGIHRNTQVVDFGLGEFELGRENPMP